MTKRQKLQDRWAVAARAILVGVATSVEEAEQDARSINKLRGAAITAKVEHNALAALLIAKGVIRETEYLEFLSQCMEEEARFCLHAFDEETGTKTKPC